MEHTSLAGQMTPTQNEDLQYLADLQNIYPTQRPPIISSEVLQSRLIREVITRQQLFNFWRCAFPIFHGIQVFFNTIIIPPSPCADS